jgi:undecaprenyl-diphosphatase
MAFLGASILSKCFGKAVIFYLIAVVVALSRVYLGLHYPSDILAGSLIGMIVGHIFINFGEKAGFYKKD